VIRGAGKFEIIVGEELVHSKATDRFPSYPDKACSYVKVYDAILKKGAEKKKRSEQQLLIENTTKWKPERLAPAQME